MITFEQIRENYPPRKVESQGEFDLVMFQLKQAQTELVEPLKTKSEALNQRRHEIGRQLAALNIELGNINRKRDTLREECREIGYIFYRLKKEMITLNPKNTYGENA